MENAVQVAAATRLKKTVEIGVKFGDGEVTWGKVNGVLWFLSTREIRSLDSSVSSRTGELDGSPRQAVLAVPTC